MRRLLLALALLLLPGCASGPELPPEPPEDFLLQVDGVQVFDPPCDLTLSLGYGGVLRWDVHHRGAEPSDRRGAQAADPAAARAVWDALVASGILALPRLDEGTEAAGDGCLVYRLTADGLVTVVSAERGTDPGLDAVLDALVAAGPARMLAPLGRE